MASKADRPQSEAQTKTRERLRVLELALLVERRPEHLELIHELIRCLTRRLASLENETASGSRLKPRFPGQGTQ